MGIWANSFKHTAGAMALTYLTFCTNSSLHQSGATFSIIFLSFKQKLNQNLTDSSHTALLHLAKPEYFLVERQIRDSGLEPGCNLRQVLIDA